MSSLLIVIVALLLDALLGEPKRYHPLVGFGRWATWVETHIYGGSPILSMARRLRGLLALTVVVVPIVMAASVLAVQSVLVAAIVLYFTLGGKSLHLHASRVLHALRQKNLVHAREYVGMIVSRDTSRLDESQVAKATVESVLENGNDAIFGALFWFLIAGAPGAVAYRLVNTLDAMWGYKNERYFYFGWAAARLDDAMNYVPARLTALSYAAVGSFRHAIRCWRLQAPAWESPNAGPVMSAGAGALHVQLGGGAYYDGEYCERPLLGGGNEVQTQDIARALKLVRHSIALWMAVVVLGVWILA